MTAPIRYARSRDVNVAYQITGDGSFDLVLVPKFFSHLEIDWEYPGMTRMLDRLGSFARLIRFDKRGTGLSDRTVGLPDFETRMDDVRAVMDASGSQQAALFGYSEGGPMCVLFAATYPERTRALVLYGTYAKRRDPDEDYPWAPTSEERVMRQVLATVQCPTLVLHRGGDRDSRPEEGRYIASRIPGARFVELSGDDHMPAVRPDDGFLAVFDGPARAIRCAFEIRAALHELGLDVRAGVHTGEVERRAGDKPRGIAVHVGARIMSSAGAGDVLVSSTTRDLVAGSGLEFEDRGEHELKGIEGARRIFAAR